MAFTMQIEARPLGDGSQWQAVITNYHSLVFIKWGRTKQEAIDAVVEAFKSDVRARSGELVEVEL